MNLKELFMDEEKRTILFLGISLVSLVLSFFNLNIYGINLVWIAIILCGLPIIKDAIIGLVTEFDIKADLLVSIALVASIIIGQIFAAGEIAFIMTIGALLEELTVNKTKAGIEKLVNLTPQTARVLRDGNEEIVSAKDLVIGDMIQVLPGETVAIDGKIVSGETSIDQSVMTGEPIPVDKIEGDEVFSGTVNQFGAFVTKATKLGKDSSLQRMIALVKSADAGKSKIVRLTDKWATWIVGIALTAAIVTYFLTGEIIRSVTILVVFCPCALVLATPTAIMGAIGNATRYGILIKEGDALERLSKVKKIIFDKTGTLTYGKPQVTDFVVYNNNSNNSNDSNNSNIVGGSNDRSPDNSYGTFTNNEILQIVASLEKKSEHPLGQSIVKYFNNIKKLELLNVENFEMIVGKGVKGKVNGYEVLAGNNELLSNNNVKLPLEWIDSSISPFVEKGSTLIYISVNNKFRGALVLGDVVRADAKEVISKVENIGLETVLLTGDSEKPATHMANAVGITNVYSNSLPETKMEVIDEYQNNGEKVAMIGDGINDAPSLKKSFVGIAMGGIGSDIAIDAADIALIGDDIKNISHLLGLSKKTMSTININIVISLALNFVAIILAMLGILDPILGALVHNVGSVLVIIYSSFLLRWK